MGLGDCLKTSDVSHANEVRNNGMQLFFLIRLTTTGLQRQKPQLVKISPSLLTLTSSQASQLYHHIVSGIALRESSGSPACLFPPPCQHAHCCPSHQHFNCSRTARLCFWHSTDFISTGLLRQLALIGSSLTNLPSWVCINLLQFWVWLSQNTVSTAWQRLQVIDWALIGWNRG